MEKLKIAEGMAENNERGLAMTYNNMACFYKKMGHMRAALTYLQQALEIESGMTDSSEKAETHLNTCEVLSQLNKHDLAMQHAY